MMFSFKNHREQFNMQGAAMVLEGKHHSPI